MDHTQVQQLAQKWLHNRCTLTWHSGVDTDGQSSHAAAVLIGGVLHVVAGRCVEKSYQADRSENNAAHPLVYSLSFPMADAFQRAGRAVDGFGCWVSDSREVEEDRAALVCGDGGVRMAR